MSDFEPPAVVVNIFAVIGFIAVAYKSLRVLLSILKNVKTFVLARPLGLATNPKRHGKWAVVTGATDGIGKAYAEQLAAKGLNVFLLSRSADKLKDVATQIEQKYKVETKTFAVDFTSAADMYPSIGDQLNGLDIGVLVNNVGMSYSFPQYFCELADSEKFLPNIININCLSVVMMTNLVLPAMVERKRGIIINVSSASGMNPSPMLTVYSATKAFVDFFSRGIDVEYRSKGIQVQCVMPFYVTTKLSKLRRETMTIPSPTSYVNSALAALGSGNRTNGCLMHNLQGWVVGSVPEWVLDSVQMSIHNAIRKVSLKKLAEKKTK
ncbi:very-long-chain 3-oxoacyl-CoA reductase-B-like [Lytechinus variegatus]|uniref:very-long-chain 3-oxoacyl-CoA reductase-B-like n=1 Tax=Lytechinus variegatus TaxID=7654 RepID=UPI001BB12EB1|nr:very-long-chain 3-oxoacyl-CoA reductase-B-like [Lytechinus variegatus]